MWIGAPDKRALTLGLCITLTRTFCHSQFNRELLSASEPQSSNRNQTPGELDSLASTPYSATVGPTMLVPGSPTESPFPRVLDMDSLLLSDASGAAMPQGTLSSKLRGTIAASSPRQRWVQSSRPRPFAATRPNKLFVVVSFLPAFYFRNQSGIGRPRPPLPRVPRCFTC